MRTDRVRWVLAGIVAATVVMTACDRPHAAPAVHGTAIPTTASSSAATVSSVPGGGSPFAAIPTVVRKVEPSVVTILTSQGLGSGVVWSADGTIVTADHVVRGASHVEVAFADGERAQATVGPEDAITDLAVVTTDRRPLPAADFATTLPTVGELVVAIGSPLGFEETVTSGIISGTQRSIPASGSGAESLVDLLQTDAPISPGNSGGALVDSTGRVVGLNEAYIPPSAGAVSIGFAIPAPTVRDTVTELVRTGHVDHAYLGAQLGQLTPEIAGALNISRQTGALVLDVVAGGPAAQAGLQPGDVIIRFADRDISTVGDLLAAVRQHRPGDTVAVTLTRQGHRTDTKVQLGSQPAGRR